MQLVSFNVQRSQLFTVIMPRYQNLVILQKTAVCASIQLKGSTSHLKYNLYNI